MPIMNVKRIERCENHPEISSTAKVGGYTPYSISTIWQFKHIKNKHTLYRGRKCIKEFCESLKEHAARIIGFNNCYR